MESGFCDITNVSVDYDDGGAGAIRALEGLSLQVARGESVAIIGPSGCGKSTLLRLMSGLMMPTRGTVAVDGALVAGPRRGTALILQTYGLLPWKSVAANAELGLELQGVPHSERRTRADAALSLVGLDGFQKARPRELSGGMQQRLALARAIAMDADLLLMDEPLSALDALLREEIQTTLLGLWLERKHTQVLVTHSIEEAVYLGQRIVVMAPRPGRIIAQVDNPGMGAPDYRASQSFFQKCSEVRSALESGLRGEAGASPREGSSACVCGSADEAAPAYTPCPADDAAPAYASSFQTSTAPTSASSNKNASCDGLSERNGGASGNPGSGFSRTVHKEGDQNA